VDVNMAHVSDASTGGSAMSNSNLGNSLDIYYQNIRGFKTKQLGFMTMFARPILT
jgi:hypothetical protein